MHILVFGDSEAYGAWDSEGGWPQRLRAFFDRTGMENNSPTHIVYNLGVSGDTSREVLKRFLPETRSRLGDEKNHLFIFAVGANDSLVINEKKTTMVSEKEFISNMKNLILAAKKFSSRIIILAINSVDETRSDPLPWLPTHSYKNNSIKKFNSILRGMCKEARIPFIDVKLSEEDLFDGVHPNSKGHEEIFREVKDFMKKAKLI